MEEPVPYNQDEKVSSSSFESPVFKSQIDRYESELVKKEGVLVVDDFKWHSSYEPTNLYYIPSNKQFIFRIWDIYGNSQLVMEKLVNFKYAHYFTLDESRFEFVRKFTES